MTDQPRRISPWWYIAIAVVVVFGGVAGWKLYGTLTPEQQRVGVWLLIAMFGIPLLARWVVMAVRRRES